MFSWFKKRKKVEKKAPLDMSLIGVDMHSHLIPNVDDGSSSFEETLQILKTMREYGYKKVITTPHIMIDGYPNTSSGLTRGLESLKTQLNDCGEQFEIEVSAEYYVDSHLSALMEVKDVLTLGDNYVLIEYSYLNKPLNYVHVIEQLREKGYKPILAHPERYMFFQGNIPAFKEIKAAGALLQMNLFSLVGAYGPGAAKMSHELIDNNMYDLIGTDIHNSGQLRYLDRVRRDPYLHKLVDSGYIINGKLFL